MCVLQNWLDPNGAVVFISLERNTDTHHTDFLAFPMNDFRISFELPGEPVRDIWLAHFIVTGGVFIYSSFKFPQSGLRLERNSKVSPGKISWVHTGHGGASDGKNPPQVYKKPKKNLHSSCNCCPLPLADRLRKWFPTEDGFIGKRRETSAIIIETPIEGNADGQMAATPDGASLLKRQSAERCNARARAPVNIQLSWVASEHSGRAGNGSASKSALSPCLSRKPSGILEKSGSGTFGKKKKKKQAGKTDLPLSQWD